MNLIDTDEKFTASAKAKLDVERADLLLVEPGAGSQNYCLFCFTLEAVQPFGPVTGRAEEVKGIIVRSCGSDPTAFELLDPPREAHFVAVKLSNDRLNHRRRDAE